MLFVLVPAGNSGLRREVIDEQKQDLGSIQGPIGLSTHNLFEPEKDPLQQRCRELGLSNALGARVKVIQVPVYLGVGDGIFDLPYEAVLRAMDLSCFPSLRAVGLHAGGEPRGRRPDDHDGLRGLRPLAREAKLTWEQGVHVLTRVGVEYVKAANALAELLEVVLAEERDQKDV